MHTRACTQSARLSSNQKQNSESMNQCAKCKTEPRGVVKQAKQQERVFFIDVREQSILLTPFVPLCLLLYPFVTYK